MPSGGYRPPASPAPVSGPGALSQRTDGGPSDDKQPIRLAAGGAYGERQEMQQLQQAAPMAETPDGPVLPEYTGGALNAPSARPGEPVTHGSPLGAGAGPEALAGAAPQATGGGWMTQLLTSMSPGGATGSLAELLRVAQTQGQ